MKPTRAAKRRLVVHALLVALGDSITYGWALSHPASQNYAALYASRTGARLVNLAIPGYTCAQVRVRLSRMPAGASTVILNCGTNDIGGFGAKNGGLPNGHHRIAPATQTELFSAEKDFKDILSTVRKREPHARIFAFTVRHWQRMTGPEDPRFAKDVTTWNAMIRKAGVQVVDIAADPRMYQPGYIQPDLIHPNVAGNKAIANDLLTYSAGPATHPTNQRGVNLRLAARRLAVPATAALLTACAQPHDATSTVVRLAPTCAQAAIHLTFVGDSLARGWGASAPQDTFASLVYADVRRTHPNATMRNLGRPGATTDEIATTEVSQLDTRDCSLVVVISGANDVQKLYSPRHFEASYARLLGNIRARSPRAGLIVIGLPDVSISPRIPWVLKPVESWLSRDDNASIAVAAQRYGAAFVPLYSVSHREAYRSKSLLSGDGIHPNDAGYRIMASTALPSVAMMLEEKR